MYSSPTHLLIPENCLGFKSTSNIIVSTGIRYLKKQKSCHIERDIPKPCVHNQTTDQCCSSRIWRGFCLAQKGNKEVKVLPRGLLKHVYPLEVRLALTEMLIRLIKNVLFLKVNNFNLSSYQQFEVSRTSFKLCKPYFDPCER